MKTNQRERMRAQILAHGTALLNAYPNASERDPLKLCSKALRLERAGRKITTDYNNGDLTMWQAEEAIRPLKKRMRDLLGPGGPAFFINWDPRGCCFKVSDIYSDKMAGVCRDMGGNFIIAPTFDGN